MTRLRFTALGLLIGLLAGTAGLAWGQGAGNTHENRPFEGTSSGTSTAGLPVDGVVTTDVAGTFWALHLGQGTYEGTLAQDYGRHPDPQCAFVSGEVILTAANGDTLELMAKGENEGESRSVACAPADQGSGGAMPGDLYRSTIYFEVIGGSGRFEDASGWVFSRGGSTVSGVSPAGVTASDTAVMLGDIDY